MISHQGAQKAYQVNVYVLEHNHFGYDKSDLNMGMSKKSNGRRERVTDFFLKQQISEGTLVKTIVGLLQHLLRPFLKRGVHQAMEFPMDFQTYRENKLNLQRCWEPCPKLAIIFFSHRGRMKTS